MTQNNSIIQGAGGGGSKKPKKPYKAPDTLHSRQFFTVQDLISEGEIEGFATPSRLGISTSSSNYQNAARKDIFLDDTPILASSASNSSPKNKDFNFNETKLKYKFGTSNQSKMGGIAKEIRTPEQVGITVTNASGNNDGAIAGSVTRQLSDKSPNQNADAVIVTLTWQQLQKFEDDGDIRGLTVNYRIQIRSSGGSYSTKVDSKVKGRSADPYSKDHRISLSGATFPVDVRVLRDTKDGTVGKKMSEFQFTAIQEVIDNNSRYLNSAYFALRLDSKEFNSIPSRRYRVRGIKVKIPAAGANNSGTPTIDSATGRVKYPNGYVFNGTMGAAQWTTCPALILLDLLINKRYGLGEHIAPDQSNDATTYSNLDLYSFIAASKYSNELVDDQFGGEEARFACNVNINGSKEAFNVINELSGIMRCMPIWSAGTITINQDKSTTSSYLFNLSNVTPEGFNYSGSSLKSRHSVVSVAYFNMDSCEIDHEIVEADDTLKDRLGTTVKKIQAFGCTSRGQAQRLGRAVLFSEQNESEVVNFTTSVDAGIVVRPGSVIEINDPVRAGSRRGGRIISATTTAITVDGSAVNNLPSLNDLPRLSVVLPNGTVEDSDIVDYSSDGKIIYVNSLYPFSAAPNPNSPYIITSNSLKTQLFRVIEVQEKDEFQYDINALSYVEGKYNFIENGDPLPERIVSNLSENVNAPSGLRVQEQTVAINGVARSKLILSWKEPTRSIQTNTGATLESPQGVSQYQVSYRYVTGDEDADNYTTQIVFSNDFEIMDTKEGKYDIEITAFNGNLQLSNQTLEETVTTKGKTSIPEDVQNLTVEPINEQFVRLQFDQTTSLDVLHGGRVYVRHTEKTGVQATFQSSQDIIEAVAGSTNSVIAPALAGTYLVKFQDDGGRFSNLEAKAEITLVDLIDSITVKTDREDLDTPAYNNTTSSLFRNTQFDSTKGGLTLINPNASVTGTYDQSNTRTITCSINSHGLIVGDIFDFVFTSGDAVSDRYTVQTVPNANQFTINSKSVDTTSGSLTVKSGMKGTYNFKDTLDLGGVFSLVLKRHFSGEGFYVSDLFDNRTELIDTWTDFDGATANEANAKIAVRATSAAPSGSVYADSDFAGKPFSDFSNGTFKGRGFQFRIMLQTTDVAQNMNLQQAGYIATMSTRTEQSGVIASGSGAKNVTFNNPFFTGTSSITGIPEPNVTISPKSVTNKIMVTGDYFELTNISGTGFTVHFKNSSGASIDRDFTFNAVGFGKGG